MPLGCDTVLITLPTALTYPLPHEITPPAAFHFKLVTQMWANNIKQQFRTIKCLIALLCAPSGLLQTLSEWLGLMWLLLIQLHKRNEQMSLFPPITTVHLALQSPLYGRHFPSILLPSVRNVKTSQMIKEIATEQSRDHDNTRQILCSDKEKRSSLSQHAAKPQTAWADILSPTRIERSPHTFFFSF